MMMVTNLMLNGCGSFCLTYVIHCYMRQCWRVNEPEISMMKRECLKHTCKSTGQRTKKVDGNQERGKKHVERKHCGCYVAEQYEE